MSEDQIQATFFQTVWNRFPETRFCLFAIPNGSTRDIREAAKLKATGLVAGQPDMTLIWKGKPYGFEFKTSTGVVSSSQRQVHQAWKSQNVPVFVFRDPQSAIEAVEAIITNKSLEPFKPFLSC